MIKKFMYASIVFLFLFINSFASKGEVIRITTFQDLKEIILAHADKDTLVLLDVDDVILQMTDDFMLTAPEREPLYNKLVSKYTRREIHIIFSDYFRKTQVELIDEGIRDLLDILEHRGVAVTVLTGCWTGKYGTINQMYKTRFRHLKDVNISFDATTPFKKDRQFPSLVQNRDDPNEEGKVPMIISGLIFSARGDKGKVLEKIYCVEKLQYKKIIFADDRLENVQRVMDACKRLNVQCVGILYRVKDMRKPPKLKESRERKRFSVLEKEHRWLVDGELDKRSAGHYEE